MKSLFAFVFLQSLAQVGVGEDDSPGALTHEVGGPVPRGRIVSLLLGTIAPWLNGNPLLELHEAKLPLWRIPIWEIKPDKQGRVVVSTNAVRRLKTRRGEVPGDIHVSDDSVLGVRLDPNDPTTLVLTGRQVGSATITVIYHDKSKPKETYEVTVDAADTQNKPVCVDRKDDEQERSAAPQKLPRKKRD